MKKQSLVLALSFGLVVGLNFSVEARATEGEMVSEEATVVADAVSNTAEVANYIDMKAALANTAVTVVNVTADIVATGVMKVNHDVLIDLNGHTIMTTAPASGKNRATFNLQSGHITIKNGTIVPQRGAGITLDTYDAVDKTATDILTVDIESDVTIKSANYYGIVIYDTSYGTSLNFAGKIEAKYGIANNGADKHTTNHLKVNVLDGAMITAQDAAVYIPGYSVWTFGKAMLNGTMGVGIKSGVVTMNGTTIKATGEAKDPISWGQGINSAGAAIQIEENTAYAGGVNLTVNGGKYSSLNNAVFVQYQGAEGVDADKVEAILIQDGKFVGKAGIGVFAGVPVEDVTIKGGRFSADVNEYAGNMKFVEKEIDGEKLWVPGENQGEDDKPTPPQTDPIEPEDTEEVKKLKTEIRELVDEIKQDEKYMKYQTLVEAVRMAEDRVKNWGVTAMAGGTIARVTVGYDASLIKAIGDAIRGIGVETTLGLEVAEPVTKKMLQAAVDEAKKMKNYEAYVALTDAVYEAEQALARGESDMEKLKDLRGKLEKLSLAGDATDPEKPLIPKVEELVKKSAGAPDTGAVEGKERTMAGILTFMISGGMIGGLFSVYLVRNRWKEGAREAQK